MLQKNFIIISVVALILGFIFANLITSNATTINWHKSSFNNTPKKTLIVVYNSKIADTEKRINELFNNYEINQIIKRHYYPVKTDVNSFNSDIPYEMLAYFQQMINPFNPYIILISDNQFNIEQMIPSTVTSNHLKTVLDYTYQQNKYRNFVEYLNKNN